MNKTEIHQFNIICDTCKKSIFYGDEYRNVPEFIAKDLSLKDARLLGWEDFRNLNYNHYGEHICPDCIRNNIQIDKAIKIAKSKKKKELEDQEKRKKAQELDQCKFSINTSDISLCELRNNIDNVELRSSVRDKMLLEYEFDEIITYSKYGI